METVNCPECGKQFSRYPSEATKRITCSRTCAARRFRDKGERIPCVRCSKLFYRRRSQATQGYGTTCSRECHFALRSKRVKCTCLQCREEFTSHHYQVRVMGGGRFCSKQCMYTFRRKFFVRQNMFTNWQKREWKDDKCARCGSTERLELDHIHPRFAGGGTDQSNAQTLCRTCNRKKFWTDDFPLWEKLLKLRAEEC
jgi:5-methylcytosine-specific restriction endonuclease McrA